jgi:hypothetical protein
VQLAEKSGHGESIADSEDSVSNRTMRHMALLLIVVCTAGCSHGVDVEKVLKVVDVHTGWYDAGIQPDGKNKLVPSISIGLQNVSTDPVRSVQINAIFRRLNEPEVAWGEHFVRAIDRDALAPGATTQPLVLRSNLGYTGTQPRMQMLQNREFVDGKVEIFGKTGSRTWVKLGEYPIDRQLLTQ